MKKVLPFILALVVLCGAVTLLSACQNGEGDTTTADPQNAEKKLIVAASSTPHAIILEQCKAAMKEKGYTLEIREMDDYIIPNTATEDGEVDANYFQHQPYLDQFNEENKTHLVSVATIHYEPLGLYAGKTKKLADLADKAKIAVPNDETNEARALQLLAANGLIKLKDGVGLDATKKDIIENPKNIEIVEMEAALISGVLDDVDMGIINGNYALQAKLDITKALATESADSEAAKKFGNILVVKEGNEKNEAVLALVEIMKSETIKNYITNNFSGAVVPMN